MVCNRLKMRKLIVFFIVFTLISACEQEAEIAGVWLLDDVRTNQKIDNPDAYRQALTQLKLTTKIIFYPNRTFKGTIWGDTTYGTWQRIGNSLTISDRSFQKRFTVEIIKLTQDKLVLKQTDDSLITILEFVRHIPPHK